jgi:hypothetical protein
MVHNLSNASSKFPLQDFSTFIYKNDEIISLKFLNKNIFKNYKNYFLCKI